MSDREDDLDPSENPLADLSPFADGNEGTNLDDDSDYELEDAEYQDDADRVYGELLERIGEAAPQPRLDATRRALELLGERRRGRDAGPQRLDRDRAPERLLDAAVDQREGPLPDHLDQAAVAEPLGRDRHASRL